MKWLGFRLSLASHEVRMSSRCDRLGSPKLRFPEGSTKATTLAPGWPADGHASGFSCKSQAPCGVLAGTAGALTPVMTLVPHCSSSRLSPPVLLGEAPKLPRVSYVLGGRCEPSWLSRVAVLGPRCRVPCLLCLENVVWVLKLPSKKPLGPG